jgi:trehalose 6-phosphate synthase/phosphatase
VSRLILVSNRLPVSVHRRGEELRFQRSSGGLATALASFYQSYRSIWLGWPGIIAERTDGKQEEIATRLQADDCFPLHLSQYDIDGYYRGFSNKTIWPLFHYFTQYVDYNKSSWEAYRRVNEAFSKKVLEVAQPDDIIWIHDYQLMLLPELIREKLPDITMGFFLHIPFPSFEVFRLLPWRNEIVRGLLGADLIGFHTYDYARHFHSSVRRLTDYEQSYGRITVGNRVVRADTFPLGIDYDRFANATNIDEVQNEMQKIGRMMGVCKAILSIDRLDYSKGIPERLEVFDLFLDRNPQYREKVTLILVVVPSRTSVNHYRLIKKHVDELVGRINGKYGTVGWTPVWYLYHLLPFNNLVALYNVADVALVTPLRDGMNLIAKEYVASKSDGRGVLILSEMAGAAMELSEALVVNPNNKVETSERLKEALAMPEEEQIERNRAMQERLKRYDVNRWANDFMDSLCKVKKIQIELSARRLTDDMKVGMKDHFQESERRLLLLDYDGTLVPFAGKPEMASPDEELIGILTAFAGDGSSEVVIVSGRDKETLESWFAPIDVGLIAEHGVWVRRRGGNWEMVGSLREDWKDLIRPILELYVDRTPGTSIEEKRFSLVWHYRRADQELGQERARELKEELLNLTAHLDVGVLEGSRVIEIKNAGINKGQAAMRWLSHEKWDFILAVGDDWTDEDIFSVVPEQAYSIKVGIRPSQAKYSVDSLEDVRSLLWYLRSSDR